MSTAALETWVSRPAAARLTGIPVRAIDREIVAGTVACRRLPGGHPRVRLGDVETIAAKFTTGPTDDGRPVTT